MGLVQFTTPRYLKIAVDISARIASGVFAQGEKLKGRSVLSTEYSVSPETIRRAMSILSDKKVVEVLPGSGIVVSSKTNAINFLNDFTENENVNDIRFQLSQAFEKSKSINDEINSLTNQILDIYKYKRSDLISPVEIQLPLRSRVIGQSIGKLEVWHNTGATIIGIIQTTDVIVSPGPYYEFAHNDIVLIVGDENVIERFNAFVSGIS